MLTLQPTPPSKREQIEQRLLVGERAADLAREFGVSKQYVSEVRKQLPVREMRELEKARLRAERAELVDFVAALLMSDGMTWEQASVQMGGLSYEFKRELLYRWPELRRQLLIEARSRVRRPGGV